MAQVPDQDRCSPIARYLRRWPSDLDLADAAARDAPVTDVSWFAAEAYCKARGPAAADDRSNGNTRSPTTAAARTRRARPLARMVRRAERRRPPEAIGGPANGYGVRDLVGLVWEWTLDFNAYATTAETRDPNGKDAAQFCGGAAAGVADPSDYPAFMRYLDAREPEGHYTADNLGFRCAGGAP